jgi:hypothetical protein
MPSEIIDFPIRATLRPIWVFQTMFLDCSFAARDSVDHRLDRIYIIVSRISQNVIALSLCFWCSSFALPAEGRPIARRFTPSLPTLLFLSVRFFNPKADASFSLVFNRFDVYDVSDHYISKTRSDSVSKSVTFNSKSFIRPFLDFGAYHVIVEVKAQKAGNYVQMTSCWSGDSQLKINRRICMFLCPFGPLSSITLPYAILSVSNHLTIVRPRSMSLHWQAPIHIKL